VQARRYPGDEIARGKVEGEEERERESKKKKIDRDV